MAKNKEANRFNMLSLYFGIWFLLTGWMWTQFLCLMIGYPVGIMGFFLWNKARKLEAPDRLSKISIGILIFAFAVSVAALFLYR